MRIVCFARNTVFHKDHGGMEIHLKVLAEGLAAKGHDMVVVSTSRDGFVGEDVQNGVRYIFTAAKAGVYSQSWYGLSRQKLLELHQERQINVVWGEGGGALALSQRLQDLSIPYVPISQGTIPGDFFSHARQTNTLGGYAKLAILALMKIHLLVRFELKYMRNATSIVVVSDELKEDVHRYYRIPRENIHVVYNGVSPDVFFTDEQLGKETREKLGIADDAFVLFSAGRVIREKGFHIGLNAFRRLRAEGRNVHYIVAGDGKYLAHLKDFVHAHGLQDTVTFLGFVQHDTLRSYYNAADVFVAPTLRAEGFPLTFCESLLCGVPVIASAFGGNPSAVINGETGFLLQTPTADEVYEKAKRLIDEPDVLIQLKKSSQEKALASFTNIAMVDGTERVFREVNI